MNEETLPKDKEQITQAPQPEVAPAREPEDDIDDLAPLTINEAKQVAIELTSKAKAAGMRPVRRAGRTYLRTFRKAADWFFDGLGAK